MPYGIDKKIGGDNKENDKWMEGCVSSVMSKGKRDKSTAIAICKSQLRKKKAKASSPEEEMMDTMMEDTLQEEEMFMKECVAKLSSQGIGNKEAEQYCKLAYQIKEGDTEASKKYILEVFIK